MWLIDISAVCSIPWIPIAYTTSLLSYSSKCFEHHGGGRLAETGDARQGTLEIASAKPTRGRYDGFLEARRLPRSLRRDAAN
jgi:hypothetical protein